MLSTTGDDYYLPEHFDELASGFNGVSVHNQIGALSVQAAPVKNAVEQLTNEIQISVVLAKVPDFETAGEIACSMMLAVYPTRSMILGVSNPTRKLGPPTFSSANNRARDIAQWILLRVASAISHFDGNEGVRCYARMLHDAIPSPFRDGGNKSSEGVEIV